MKNLILGFFYLLLFTLSACATTQADTNADETKDLFNPELALEVGADDYGMRSYVLVVLKTGPAVIEDETRRQEIFSGHFANMKKLGAEGLLVLAGPFVEGGEKRGLYVFNVVSIEKAQALVNSDPAVAAGIFVPEFTKFYGSAALMKIYEIHLQIQKTKIG